MKSKIWPSVMVSNQKDLNKLLGNLRGVSDTLHLDVSDGKFVPTKNMWFNFKLIKEFSYSAHLMVNDPKKWIEKNGDRVEFCISQWEVIKKKDEFIAWLWSKQEKVAFALKPETKVSSIKKYLPRIDYVLVLTVHPGYYGAKFLKAPLKKISEIKKINPNIKVIVDGGMTPDTIGLAAQAGTDYFVSGSFVSKSDNPKKAIKELEKAL